MRLLIIAVLLFMFAVFTVRGAKLTITTSVDSAKTGGQIILCNHYAGENPKDSEAIKKLEEKLEAILKLLQSGAHPSDTGWKTIGLTYPKEDRINCSCGLFAVYNLLR